MKNDDWQAWLITACWAFGKLFTLRKAIYIGIGNFNIEISTVYQKVFELTPSSSEFWCFLVSTDNIWWTSNSTHRKACISNRWFWLHWTQCNHLVLTPYSCLISFFFLFFFSDSFLFLHSIYQCTSRLHNLLACICQDFVVPSHVWFFFFRFFLSSYLWYQCTSHLHNFISIHGMASNETGQINCWKFTERFWCSSLSLQEFLYAEGDDATRFNGEHNDRPDNTLTRLKKFCPTTCRSRTWHWKCRLPINNASHVQVPVPTREDSDLFQTLIPSRKGFRTHTCNQEAQVQHPQWILLPQVIEMVVLLQDSRRLAVDGPLAD